jgi:two-component system LytT family response regulator
LENRNPPEIFAKQIQTLFGNKNGFERISVPTLDGLRFILLNDILQCEADDNYTFFYLAGGERLLITRTLKEYEEILSDLGFIRVHHSHLVNSKYIERYIKGEGGTVILSDGSRIEVSRRRKAEFLRYLSERILGK